MTPATEQTLPVPSNEQIAATRARGIWRLALRRLLRQPVTLASLAILLALLLVGAFAHELAPHGWNTINLSPRWKNAPPTFDNGNLFGTDSIGTSVLIRTIWGLHYSAQVAVVGALLAVAVGLVLGALAGLYGGFLDAVLMRFADLVTGFPVLMLMLLVFGLIRNVTIWQATFVFAFSLWPFVARVVRARIASIRPEEYVHAARALGASDFRILVRHLLPNTIGAVVVSFTSLIGQIALVEATVEFFGVGVPTLIRPTLGNLIAGSTQGGIGPYNYLGLGWWTWVFPGTALVLLLVTVNLVGDGLDVALNPRAGRA
jgi:ABC-type dipeptide/oligopeptide/nickel transport system permease subunit